EKGDLDGAISDYSQAIAFKPNFGLAYDRGAHVKQVSGDSDGALADYTSAIAQNPKDIAAYFNRGCLRYNQCSYSDALGDLRKAAELDDASSFAVYSRILIWLIHTRLGQQEAATRELETYLVGG